MPHTRNSQILNMTIQVHSPLQHVDALPVQISYAETVVDSEGNQVGHTHHFQRPTIRDDIALEVLNSLNTSLAIIGYKLVPIAEE